MKRRIFSLLTCLALVISLLPTAAFAADSEPTIDTVNNVIYANGVTIYITAGEEEGKTAVYYTNSSYDTVYLNTNDAAGDDLSAYTIYGGSKTETVEFTSIVMSGGAVGSIYGGGETGTVSSFTSITMTDGAVGAIYGGGRGVTPVEQLGTNDRTTQNITAAITAAQDVAKVTGSTTINISGGTVANVYGGGQYGMVAGNTTVKVTGGTITGDGGSYSGVLGGGLGSNGSLTSTDTSTTYKFPDLAEVTGNTTVDISGGATVRNVFGGGIYAKVTGSTAVTISGGTITTNVYGGGCDGSVGGTTVSVTGGTISGTSNGGYVFGGGYQGDVSGNTSVTIGSGVTIPKDVEGDSAIAGTVTGTANITIAGTVQGSVIGGASGCFVYVTGSGSAASIASGGDDDTLKQTCVVLNPGMVEEISADTFDHGLYPTNSSTAPKWILKGAVEMPLNATLTVSATGSLATEKGRANSAATDNESNVTPSLSVNASNTIILSGTVDTTNGGTIESNGADLLTYLLDESDVTFPDQLRTGNALEPAPVIATTKTIMDAEFTIITTSSYSPNCLYSNNTDAGTATVHVYNTLVGYDFVKTFQIYDFSAAVANVNVLGKPNEALASTYDVNITLTGETFLGIDADTDVFGWFSNLPNGLTAKVKSAVAAEGTAVTITISGTPTEVSSGHMVITIPAVHLSHSLALPVTVNGFARFNIAETTYDVTLYNDIYSNSEKTSTSSSAQTVVPGSAIEPVVYTADDGYYFAGEYPMTKDGLTITRSDDYRTITVTGIPNESCRITIPSATAKTQANTPAATFTATGADTGTLTDVTAEMDYSIDGGESWVDCTGETVELTGLSAGTITVRHPGGNTTTAAAETQSIEVTKASTPTVTGTDCTTTANDDGKITGVNNTMEYRSDNTSWTACTGTELTGLAPGTYYVRVKASGIMLASASASVTIAGINSYTITVNSNIAASIGTVTADKTTAAAGETITVTVTVNNSSYEFGSLIVTGTSSDNEVPATTVTDGFKYTFTMPSENVEVEASWTRLLEILTVTAEALDAPAEGKLTLTVNPVMPGSATARYYYRNAGTVQPAEPAANSPFNAAGWTQITDFTTDTASIDLVDVSDGSYIEVVRMFSMDDSGSGTIQAWGVTTATDDGYEPPAVLGSVEQPESITGVPNGTALESIVLPTTVTITTTKGTTYEAAITWNTTAVSYDPGMETEQTFTVSGTVTLPAGVTNTGNVSLDVRVSVTVAAKDAVTVTGISVKTAPEKTTYTEGDALDLTGLVVTLTCSDSTTEDVAFADFAAKDVTAHPSNGTALSTSETTVTVHAGNYSASFPITVNASAPKTPVSLTLTPSTASLSGGGTVTLTLTGLPSGGTATVSCDKSVTITQVSTTSWSVSLPNITAAYVFTASFAGDDTYSSAAATCTVNVTYKSSGDDGGSSGYTPSTPSTQSITVPISGDDNTIHVGATVSGDKAAVKDVDLSKLDTVIGDHVDTGTVTIDFSELKTTKPITTVEIPADVVKEIAEAVSDPSNDAESLEIILSDGTSIEFDAEALGEKSAQASGADITISIKASKGNSAQSALVGDRPAFDINVTSGGKHISDMGGKITVHAPYVLKDGELPRGIIVYYVDDNGNKEACVTSYDPIKQRVNWKTDHLSLYMIDYDEGLLNPFTDVSEDAYYFDAVLWAVDEGITNGTSATTFSPDASCTRAQMATFLWCAAGSPDPVGSTNPFTDVSADAYYAKAVQWAVEQGITVGTSDTTFSPDADCTRAQMATFLWRNAGSPAPAGSTDPFADVSADAYYAKAVQWAYEQKITGGTSATTFSPDDPCTRAQMVTFLYRNFAD